MHLISKMLEIPFLTFESRMLVILKEQMRKAMMISHRIRLDEFVSVACDYTTASMAHMLNACDPMGFCNMNSETWLPPYEGFSICATVILTIEMETPY